ncbi:hypothetical protein [Sansalvadorimonas verongulae]|uniref:hypothetical protein n=1 Tax=Sansalvadorimonas verongulae TaxID=2172824 RepID=UPI0012BD6A43|nr:hypothetical protein [Sansalvadorimonas verongulae]MTI13998.1 hypothetical protein [Sansalvadorimonas verongulae]
MSISIVQADIPAIEAVSEVADRKLTTFQEYFQSPSKAEDEMKQSLKMKDTVFGIPVFGNERTKPETLHRTVDTLTKILDQSGAGQADKPELVRFMSDNNFKVVIAGNGLDLDNLNPNDFPKETTAEISSSGLNIDDYFLESLRLVTEAHIIQLKKNAQRAQDQTSKDELESLKTAIAQLQANGLGFEDDDGDDCAAYLVMAQVALSGQLPTILERLLSMVDKAVQFVPADEMGVFETDLPEPIKKWKSFSPESFQAENPLVCEWLARNALSAPIVDIESVEVALDEETIEDLGK